MPHGDLLSFDEFVHTRHYPEAGAAVGRISEILYNEALASAGGPAHPLPGFVERPTDSPGLMPAPDDPQSESLETPPPFNAPAVRTWDRINALFHAALDLEPDAREALLARIDKRDPKLATEVRSLIASHEEAGEF